MTDAAPPTLSILEDVVRRYGLLVKWVIAAAIAATVWVTSMTFRVAALEKSMDKVVNQLDPVRDSLNKIENSLGIAREKPR